jgi:probable phosphomutase (TIGR03848 family)
MATVLLVRHGRTSANSAGVLAGRSPGTRLDEAGAAQVAATGERLAQVRLAAVVTSPLERCRQTARALAERQAGDVPVERERGLLEVEYGEWTGRELKALAKDPLWRVVQAHPAAVTFPGGESMAAMSARAVAAVRRWDARVEAEHGPGAVWAAVSHGDVIKAVLADALGVHLDEFQRIVVDPSSVSVVRYTALRPFVVMSNTVAGDLAFLTPPPKRRGRGDRAPGPAAGDAVVGGGAGPAPPLAAGASAPPVGRRSRG